MIKINRITSELQQEILKTKLEDRTNVAILTADKNPKHEVNRTLVTQLCSEDWKYFVNNFLWLQDPEAANTIDKELPFLLYDFQELAGNQIVAAIINGYDFPIEKSRKMGITWLVLAIFLWGWHFHKWDLLVGSRKAEEVDRRGDMGTLFQKVRYMMTCLPEWLFQPLHTNKHDKGMTLLHPQHGASIVGEGNNPDFGRSDRRKACFLDEFTSWEQTDKASWQGLSATTQSRIPVSTPNTRGTACYFYLIIQDAKKKDKPFLSLHWPLHPSFSKNITFDELGLPTSPWYEKEKERAADEQSVAQEIDINYDVAMSGKVFPMYDKEQVDSEIKYDSNLPLYVTWDFGLDSTAMLWIQHNPSKGLFYIVDEYVNKSLDVYHYLDILDSKEYKSAIHFGDPHSGESRQITSGNSPGTILRRHGIIFKSQRAKITSRINAGRNMLKNFKISPSCQLAIEMFREWQMRKPKTGNTDGQIPDHSVHSHIGEAYTYFCFNFSNTIEKPVVKRKTYNTSVSGVM